MAKKEIEIKSENKSIFIPLHTQSVGKSFFMKQVVYGLEKHGYSVGKYDGNPEHGDFIKSFGDARELPFAGEEFFKLFKQNQFDSLCLDLPVNYIDILFEVTNETIEKSNNRDHHKFLKLLSRQKYNKFFLVPLGSDVDKTEATLTSIDLKTKTYQPKDGEKINLLIIKNKGLWKTTGKSKELDERYNKLAVIKDLKENPLFNVIEFTANENFASIKDQIKISTIDNIIDNEVVQSNGIWEDVAFEIQEEAERLYQAYSPFL